MAIVDREMMATEAKLGSNCVRETFHLLLVIPKSGRRRRSGGRGRCWLQPPALCLAVGTAAGRGCPRGHWARKRRRKRQTGLPFQCGSSWPGAGCQRGSCRTQGDAQPIGLRMGWVWDVPGAAASPLPGDDAPLGGAQMAACNHGAWGFPLRVPGTATTSSTSHPCPCQGGGGAVLTAGKSLPP